MSGASPNSLPHRGHAIEELFEQENPRFSLLPVWFLVGIVPAVIVATGNRLVITALVFPRVLANRTRSPRNSGSSNSP